MRTIALALFGLLCTISVHAKEIVITSTNAVYVTNNINPFMMAAAAYEVSSNKDIQYLVVDSNGGIISGIEILAGAVSKRPEIKVLILRAASAAAAITQLVKNDRYISKNGSMMFHRVRFHFSEGGYTLDEIEERIEDYKQSDKEFADQCSRRLKITRDEFDLFTIGLDWELSAEEAVAKGAAEQIVKARCSIKFQNMNEEFCNSLKSKN